MAFDRAFVWLNLTLGTAFATDSEAYIVFQNHIFIPQTICVSFRLIATE
jgi:hypothetical protein